MGGWVIWMCGGGGWGGSRLPCPPSSSASPDMSAGLTWANTLTLDGDDNTGDDDDDDGCCYDDDDDGTVLLSSNRV